ncbi:hypothetical protein JCM21531_4485 [Acetivibrio straminisolvens JCM 21531]|uniref:ChlI/MoxR AAA lid domain-containing protein n=1 Tax=Acetivibrio straminisolvens JCM 21531 TaxID=1294263 RepID=W4VBQ8_9FIRM|nr:hypothetical protein JCM21531_4485 [Acetivibrio straminisolvens JCM 21531]
MLKAVQVYAILKGRGYVEPDDVKAMAKPVLCHRLVLKNAIMAKGQAEIIIDQILNEAVVPSEENLHKG